MGNRLTKIYTRTGDKGTTALANGDRISKSDLVFAVMGDVDELNAHIGMITAHAINLNQKSQASHRTNIDDTQCTQSISEEDSIVLDRIIESFSVVQHLLFNVGGELAMPDYKGISSTHIQWLENEIDHFNSQMPHLKDFILPAGSVLVSEIHIARTVCRRAERLAVTLLTNNEESITSYSLQLLNRLSDWLFVLSRYCAKLEGSKEVLWDKTILDRFDS